MLFRSYDLFLEQNFAQVYPKHKWVKLSPKERKKWREELFSLIQTAYKSIGGHFYIKTPDDLAYSDFDVIRAVDIDEDPDPDIMTFGSNQTWGVKLSGGGHDGKKQAKVGMIKAFADWLQVPGHYIEVSDRLAHILLAKKLPIVADEETIGRVLNKKDIIFLGYHPQPENNPHYGWYQRNIAGRPMIKILLGQPKI